MGGVRPGKRARQPGERLLLRAGEGGEAARQLEQPPLPGARPGGLVLAQALEEVARLDPERLCDGVEPAGRDPVHAPLVLVRLLVGDPDQLGQLLLGHPEREPALAHLGPDMAVRVLGTGPPGPRPRHRRTVPHRLPPWWTTRAGARVYGRGYRIRKNITK